MKLKNCVLALVATSTVGCAIPKKTDSTPQDPPKILKPVVRKIWIAPEIRNGGSEWAEGHYLYRIEKETTWSR